ncbi:MAG: DUF2163 domain-containing protein [Alphaproteobacteria bacterium]|nr:DUF2163 domain-containing protein [Alphaproteobacteria bacterium]
MKPASAALKSLLATRQFYAADLYIFALVGGGNLRYCAGDRDIVANGFTYPAGGSTGPYFDRKDNKAKCHWKIGVEVDQLVFDVLPGNATVLGSPFLSAVLAGIFDGAELTLERAFMAAYGDTSAGTVILFAGRVAEIDCGRSLATFTVNSHLELLNLNLPRNLWQAGCVAMLGDAACGVNLASYAVGGAAAMGSTANVVLASLAQATGYFDQGKISFTAGANAGLSRGIKTWIAGGGGAPGTVSLIAPFPTAPATADTFQIYPGCDKTLGSGGCAKFANTARFRGFPYVPTPETAV